MIDSAKFPSELSHHDKFLSCHLIINKQLPGDRGFACGFIDADFFFKCWSLDRTENTFQWTPFKNANIFPQYYDHFGMPTFLPLTFPPLQYSRKGQRKQPTVYPSE